MTDDISTVMTIETKLQQWQTAPEYHADGLQITLAKFREVSDLLIERPNLNSSHLFRADILSDSAGILQTALQREEASGVRVSLQSEGLQAWKSIRSPKLEGYTCFRTIVRRLIPRKPKLDAALEQSCFIYSAIGQDEPTHQEQLVVYVPHLKEGDKMPWYHPPVKALAYCYKQKPHGSSVSLHYLPLSSEAQSSDDRLHRTFISLLQTIFRLAKLEKPGESPASDSSTTAVRARSTAPANIKDSILPQHIVQDTYTRLKEKYAADLIARWVEKTEPSKHVFEDLAIAAFLIELWRQMYGKDHFPGFIDIACGNGVLVYVLVKEGYDGKGFDARRRKTWEMLDVEGHLDEALCIPRPFVDIVANQDLKQMTTDPYIDIFTKGTFIISNHADELTLWTPILAALSCPESPLPFLAIPCCSHALSGARHRYAPKDIDVTSAKPVEPNNNNSHNATLPATRESNDENDQDPQPPTGDLKALRLQKSKAANHADDKSQYACLTKKTVALAEELGYETEMTLIRIPSTRNIGIVGNRKKAAAPLVSRGIGLEETDPAERETRGAEVRSKVSDLISRECERCGGVESAARTWIERARKLQTGGGRGKVNLGKTSVHTVMECHEDVQ